MLLFDVNVLLYALRPQFPHHERSVAYLEAVINGAEPYAMCNEVLASVIRIATNPRMLEDPNTLDEAIAFAMSLVRRSTCIRVSPGPRHWELFLDLCRQAKAKANVVPDAWLAAMAIENGCELITTDHGFARFPTLRWCDPFET